MFSGKQYDISSGSMYLTDIRSIGETSNRPRVIQVAIGGHGDYPTLLWLEQGQVASKFIAILRDAVNTARGMASQTQANPADRLRELAKLHQEGFINDAEFEQKRREILGKL